MIMAKPGDLVWEFNKASATGPKEVESLVLCFTQPIEDFDTLHNARLNYDAQGSTLADLLAETLPGGTLDAMVRRLLERKASLLRVPMFEETEPKGSTGVPARGLNDE